MPRMYLGSQILKAAEHFAPPRRAALDAEFLTIMA
jgi:hypothetical protein